MAHFAQLDENNNVIQIDVINNEVINNLPFPESEAIGVAFLKSLYGENTVWVQTSVDNNFRQRYAFIGGSYDSVMDIFMNPKPSSNAIRTPDGLDWETVNEIEPDLEV